VLFPVHPNPAVRAQVTATLGGVERVTITEPLEYPDLVRALRLASLVLTDSGGIQEEAPSFRVPVLITRELTERMEAVETGWAQLVGTDPAEIVAAAKGLLDGIAPLPATGNPFGDGHSARRGAEAIGWLLGHGSKPEEFASR